MKKNVHQACQHIIFLQDKTRVHVGKIMQSLTDQKHAQKTCKPRGKTNFIPSKVTMYWHDLYFFWILSVWKIWSNEKNIIEKTSTWFLLFTVLLHVFYTCFGHCMFYMFLHVFWTMHDFNMFLHAFLNNECVLQFFLIMRVYLNVLCMFVRALDRIMEFFRIQM